MLSVKKYIPANSRTPVEAYLMPLLKDGGAPPRLCDIDVEVE